MGSFKGRTAPSCLLVKELEKAELEIIKFSQRKMFPEELSTLQKGKALYRA